MNYYKAINKQIFRAGDYSLVPIRRDDRFAIMKWRNEQIYHLRQPKPLTEEDQNLYFDEVVANLFTQDYPSDMLFSYLEGERCIGYGGLVHINWTDKNAEISFIMDTSLEQEYFQFHWSIYLSLIEEVAFNELRLHKIFTFAFDLRPQLYPILESLGYRKEAVLTDHCQFEGNFKDVVIHSKIPASHRLRKATKEDVKTTYQWASNREIRRFSFNQKEIDWESHEDWFYKKINEEDCEYYILLEKETPIGSIRFDVQNKEAATVNYLIEPRFHGKGFGKLIVVLGLEKLKISRPEVIAVCGLVLNKNLPSLKIFSALDFSVEHRGSDQTAFVKNI